MAYHVTEIFYTLQGEGHWTGRPAVFCRFSRCNLWTGHNADRGRAICNFCDTDFVASDRYDSAHALADAVEALWPDPVPCSLVGRAPRMVVLTGGEPSLQIDDVLVRALHSRWFYVAVETNGTRPLPDRLDWVCVSPKAGTELKVPQADELKVVWPQRGLNLAALADYPATHYWLSPMDMRHLPDIEEGALLTEENTAAALQYVLEHPQWRLNLQTHKAIGIR